MPAAPPAPGHEGRAPSASGRGRGSVGGRPEWRQARAREPRVMPRAAACRRPGGDWGGVAGVAEGIGARAPPG